jgi:hypothetical protein
MGGKPERNWSVVMLCNGQPSAPVALAMGITSIGRDPSNPIHLPDPSISRRHAELVHEGDTLRVRDLGSRNGVRVNGVPRVEAVLQHGDTVEVGNIAFQVSATPGAPLPRAVLSAPTPSTDELDPTRRQRVTLPRLGNERSLYTLYHVCSWLAEDLEEDVFNEKCLPVLLEGLEAREVQLYLPGGRLASWAGEQDGKTVFRLAPFLCARFHRMPETAVVPGRDVRRHQSAAGKFNFLAGPLRPSAADETEVPFLLVLRPTEWREFTVDDRVMLQAVCQLWVRALRRARDVAALRSENASLKRQRCGPQLLGDSAVLQTLREQAARAARTHATVTVWGETGSGKEVAAHFIHANSPRAQEPFVKVNCAAIPEGLIESELFGHLKGSFTGARANHRGKFEQAHGGTLFLDEIGEMPLAIQAKVLRAIEAGEIEKLGSERLTTVDVRVIAASHRDLKRLVQERQFREDLFYRLNVLTLNVPPLRDHLEDIHVLAPQFLEQFCGENGLAALEFEPAALEELKRHSWPGNVRELRNVIQRCAVHADAGTISALLVRTQIDDAGR